MGTHLLMKVSIVTLLPGPFLFGVQAFLKDFLNLFVPYSNSFFAIYRLQNEAKEQKKKGGGVLYYKMYRLKILEFNSYLFLSINI